VAASIINCEKPAEADVVLFGVPYDGTSSFRKGADRGPAAIKACLDAQIEFYDRLSQGSPAEKLAIAYVPIGDLGWAAPVEMIRRVRAEYGRFSDKLRIILGGEHSVTNAPLLHFAADAASITVVQIDAHADLREDDSDYSDSPAGEFAHCSVMRRAYDYGFQLVQVGIRAYSEDELALFQQPRIRVFEWGGDEPTVADVIAAIPTRKIYLTIDVDGLDPAHMPATGTPVPGGLNWHYCNDLVRELCGQKTLIGADIVEVAPREGDCLTEYAAAQLCYSLIGCWQRFSGKSGFPESR
jgi:agmatinase